jgi:hypothetical protein
VAPFEYLAAWHQEIDSGRAWQDGLPGPLPYQEIISWLVCTGRPATRTEINILKEIDMIWRSAVAEERSLIAERERPE